MLATATPAWAIIFGEVDEDNQFANVGAIVVLPRPGSGNPPRVICSGTLVHSRVFLTAGHCTEVLENLMDVGMPLWAIRVSFGVDALDEKTWHDVADVITHPDYGWEQRNGTANPRDVGVIILAKPVRKIEPALLAPPGLLDALLDAGELSQGVDGGTPLLVAGYGRTLEFPPPETIRPDGFRRFAVSEYQALTDAWLIVSQNPALDNSGTSFGDSGGPTFWFDPETGVAVIIAVTSWGDANSLSIDFRYRTDIPETLDFLEGVVEAVESGLL
ncbi:MAG: S1 family peptidase [Planctomycetota bacterium]